MSNVFENKVAGIIPSEKLYLNEDLADVNFTIASNGEVEKVPANKAILAVLSPVFKTMFFGEMREGGDVAIVDADAETFAEFLQFFYLNQVTLTTKNVTKVARLADKYDISDHIVASFIDRLSIENMCLGYQFGLILEQNALIKYCEHEITRSPKEIFATESFQNCDRDLLRCIIQLDLICMEVDIFNACIKWAKNACRKNGLDENLAEHLKIQLNDCLYSIRFTEMGRAEFSSTAFFYRGLFTAEEFEDIKQTFTVKGHKSALFEQGQRTYNWIKSKEFKCARKTDASSDYVTYYKLKSEWVSFSSNQPLLLGYIYSHKINKKDSSNPRSYINQILNSTVKITVSETEHDPVVSSHAKIIYTGESKNWRKNRLKICFPHGILIKPHNIYQIYIKIRPSYLRFHTRECKPAVEFDDLTVNFYRNPKLTHDNVRHAWLSHFIFMHI